jgi:hypothetical protein
MQEAWTLLTLLPRPRARSSLGLRSGPAESQQGKSQYGLQLFVISGNLDGAGHVGPPRPHMSTGGTWTSCLSRETQERPFLILSVVEMFWGSHLPLPALCFLLKDSDCWRSSLRIGMGSGLIMKDLGLSPLPRCRCVLVEGSTMTRLLGLVVTDGLKL